MALASLLRLCGFRLCYLSVLLPDCLEDLLCYLSALLTSRNCVLSKVLNATVRFFWELGWLGFGGVWGFGVCLGCGFLV